MRTVTQYAYAWCGRQAGPWRSRRQEAELDALREGRAQRDSHSRQIFLIVPASVITRKVEPPMPDHPVHRAQRPVLRVIY